MKECDDYELSSESSNEFSVENKSDRVIQGITGADAEVDDRNTR